MNEKPKTLTPEQLRLRKNCGCPLYQSCPKCGKYMPRTTPPEPKLK